MEGAGRTAAHSKHRRQRSVCKQSRSHLPSEAAPEEDAGVGVLEDPAELVDLEDLAPARLEKRIGIASLDQGY